MSNEKVLFITNLPTPYRIDYCNALGVLCDLTVIVEGMRWSAQQFDWNDDGNLTFKLIYLEEQLCENKIKWKVFAYFKKYRFDKIIIGCYHTRTQSLGILYLKLKHIPYFFETDGGMNSPDEHWLKKKLKQILIKGAKGYFSPSKGSDEYLMYYGAPKELIYRYPFTSLLRKDILEESISQNEKKRMRNQLGIDEEKMILTVGQFIHRKGFDILIQAAKFLPNNVGIYIIGGKPTTEYITLKQTLGLPNIHFVEFKGKHELSTYYKATDLFVLPTREDIWGLVINEAMAYGLPVISTNRCKAAMELIPQQEYIIAPDNIDALAHAMNVLLNDSVRLLEVGKENLYVIQKYTIEEMANSIYKKL
jgi:glycosyltransferase involved in cell wall biosynthesis